LDKKNGIGCHNTDDDADFIYKHYSYNSLKLAVVKHQFSSGKDKLNQDIRNGGRCFNGNEPSRKFFCIVRNPWEHGLILEIYFRPQISFKKFLSIPFNKLNNFQYKHSIPQYDYISDYKGKIDYLDHIGKIEDIQHSLDYICNTLNINFCDLNQYVCPGKSILRTLMKISIVTF